MKGKLIKGRILVREIPSEKVINGIIIPDTSLDSKQRNGVCVIGGVEVNEGDNIVYQPKGFKLTIEGEEFVLLSEADVLYITE